MFGISLLFIGAVLFINGLALHYKWSARENAPFNLIVGGLALCINLIALYRGKNTADYLSVACGLLFAFTYLYLCVVQWYGLEGEGLGWYSLFVAINTVPMAYIALNDDLRMSIMWLLWGALWLSFFLSLGLKKNLAWLGLFTAFIGVSTCWIPGLMMLMGSW